TGANILGARFGYFNTSRPGRNTVRMTVDPYSLDLRTFPDVGCNPIQLASLIRRQLIRGAVYIDRSPRDLRVTYRQQPTAAALIPGQSAAKLKGLDDHPCRI